MKYFTRAMVMMIIGLSCMLTVALGQTAGSSSATTDRQAREQAKRERKEQERRRKEEEQAAQRQAGVRCLRLHKKN